VRNASQPEPAEGPRDPAESAQDPAIVPENGGVSAQEAVEGGDDIAPALPGSPRG